MALVLADVGADEILKAYFNNSFPATTKDLTLKLFTSNTTPADTDTAATYTEASGGGYAAKTLTNGSWSFNSVNDPSKVSYAEQTFTFTGPLTGNATVYGYYVVNADGVLIFAERFGTPFTPANNGDNIKVTLNFELSKGTPS